MGNEKKEIKELLELVNSLDEDDIKLLRTIVEMKARELKRKALEE